MIWTFMQDRAIIINVPIAFWCYQKSFCLEACLDLKMLCLQELFTDIRKRASPWNKVPKWLWRFLSIFLSWGEFCYMLHKKKCLSFNNLLIRIIFFLKYVIRNLKGPKTPNLWSLYIKIFIGKTMTHVTLKLKPITVKYSGMLLMTTIERPLTVPIRR